MVMPGPQTRCSSAPASTTKMTACSGRLLPSMALTATRNSVHAFERRVFADVQGARGESGDFDGLAQYREPAVHPLRRDDGAWRGVAGWKSKTSSIHCRR